MLQYYKIYNMSNKNSEKKLQDKQHEETLDSLGITLVTVMISMTLSLFSIIRNYLVWYLAIVASISTIALFGYFLRLSGRDGILKKVGAWLTKR